MLANAGILSAAPSYARFSFRRFLFRVKRKWQKKNNYITSPYPINRVSEKKPSPHKLTSHITPYII